MSEGTLVRSRRYRTSYPCGAVGATVYLEKNKTTNVNYYLKLVICLNTLKGNKKGLDQKNG